MKQAKKGSRNFLRCAFCRHWGDIENAHIRAVTADKALWKYNEVAVCKCGLNGNDTRADYGCDGFDGKV